MNLRDRFLKDKFTDFLSDGSSKAWSERTKMETEQKNREVILDYISLGAETGRGIRIKAFSDGGS